MSVNSNLTISKIINKKRLINFKVDNKVNTITDETKILIEKIFSKRQKSSISQSENLKINQILQKPSLKEKYEELITKKRVFLLPMEYKNLLEIFETIDSAFYLMMKNKKKCFFNQIQSVYSEK